MGTTRGGARRLVALAALLLLAGPHGWLHAESAPTENADKTWRSKALELNDLTGSAPMKGKLKQLIDDEAGTKKLLRVAKQMVKEKPQPFNRNASLLLALAAENFKDVESSAAFYRLNALQSLKLFSERGLAQAYLGLIQMYSDNKKYSESEKVCKEFLALEGEEESDLERFRPLVMRRMILAIARQGQMDKALKLVDDMVKADGRNWLHRALKAQVLRQADKLEEAAAIYLDVIERVKKDDRIPKEEKQDYIDEYRYSLSGVYSELNQVDKAADQLKALLTRDPNNPTYNNDLGFIWAEHGQNLVEAEKLIRKALEEERKLRQKAKLKGEDDRDNGAYLDSLGWVLFKQGKAKEAKPYLVQAVKDKDGQNIEIYDHLADVCMALGDKAEAVAAWKKGLEFVTPSKRDQKRKEMVEKKLQSQEKSEEK